LHRVRGQARDAGFSKDQIAGRVRRGEWIRVHRMVLRYASGQTSPQQAICAAVLACGQGAVASHRSAAIVWGFDVRSEVPEVSVPSHRHPRVDGVHLYRTSTLRRIDSSVHKGVPVTNPCRTLLDLAGVLDELTLEQCLDKAIRDGLTSLQSLSVLLARRAVASSPGAGVLRALISCRRPGRGIGGSLATRLFSILRQAGLPLPEYEYRVMTAHGPRFIDFAYPDRKLAIEVDDYDSHSTRPRFDSDRIRRWDLKELGWDVVEVTWTLIRQPREVVWRMATALGKDPRGWRDAPVRDRSRPQPQSRPKRQTERRSGRNDDAPTS
jgi:very-short-patch-repair endonuclease